MTSVFSSIAGSVGRYLTDYRSVRQKIGLRWWLEIILIAVFYIFYSLIRNSFGSGNVGWQEAFENAEDIIAAERFLGLYQELRIQEWFIDWEIFIRFWNVFYGFFHFAATGIVLIWLFFRFPRDFARWRTIGLFTTGLGLIGFSLYPLMPPRLLGASIAEFGAGMPDVYTFVDTVKEFGGLWDYNSGAFRSISNQYAAMPSLHFAWASWCAVVLYPKMRHNYSKALVVLYPVATLFSIVVTANHFWLDAVGGLGALLIGYIAGTYLHKYWDKIASRLPASREDSQAEGDAVSVGDGVSALGAKPETFSMAGEPAELATGLSSADPTDPNLVSSRGETTMLAKGLNCVT